MKTYFLRPGGTCEEEIFSTLEKYSNISMTCQLCMAYFTHKRLFELIKTRHENGLRTEIILNAKDIIRPIDEPQGSFTLFLQKSLLDVFSLIKSFGNELLEIRIPSDRPQKTMHHKFILFDNVLGFGSMNFTHAGLGQNYENFSILTDNHIVENFRSEFIDLWNKAEELKISRGKLRNLACPNCSEENGIDFESYGLLCIFCKTRFNIRSS